MAYNRLPYSTKFGWGGILMDTNSSNKHLMENILTDDHSFTLHL